ncbi:MAG: hypothetical protein IPJ65_41190 [Archangiaceae bacterium]|nr:hypothetical protein [Archangiaceae bacterium]
MTTGRSNAKSSPPHEERDLTDQEALLESKRRWGDSGAVRQRAPSPSPRGPPGRLARYRYTVGDGRLGAACREIGYGNTWREAFAAVSRRPANLPRPAP